MSDTAAPARAGGRALVCVEGADRQRVVRAALEQLGYAPEVPSGAPMAVDRLRRAVYAVVVVDEGYGDAAAPTPAVLDALDTLPMAVRREMFVALLGEDLQTLDPALAFARSVNAVVNARDLGRLAALLAGAIADNDAFYRVFREALRAAGRG